LPAGADWPWADGVAAIMQANASAATQAAVRRDARHARISVGAMRDLPLEMRGRRNAGPR